MSLGPNLLGCDWGTSAYFFKKQSKTLLKVRSSLICISEIPSNSLLLWSIIA